MMTYTPLGGNKALSFGPLDFPAPWPVIIIAAAAIILVVVVFAAIVAFTPRHEARHAHGRPRHARAETTSAGEAQGIASEVMGDDPMWPQSLRPVPADMGPDSSLPNGWARA